VHRAEKNRVEKKRCIRRNRRIWGGPLDIISTSTLFILQPVLFYFFYQIISKYAGSNFLVHYGRMRGMEIIALSIGEGAQ
jgi:hypothetical protein